MADKPDKKPVASEPEGEEYELLPHKDILELKEQLASLKARPTEKNLQISMVELSTKMDRLIEIFDEAQAQMKQDGGGLISDQGMKSFSDKLDKVLEQNTEIARGIVGLSDLITELKESLDKSSPASSSQNEFMEPLEGPPSPAAPSNLPPLGQPFSGPSRLPPLGPPGVPLPPPPVRRR